MSEMSANDGFDLESERARYEGLPEYEAFAATTPDAIEMMTSHLGEKGLRGAELGEYWNNIGRGLGGFYDEIRENGCTSCGSYTPGCCDGCA